MPRPRASVEQSLLLAVFLLAAARPVFLDAAEAETPGGTPSAPPDIAVHATSGVRAEEIAVEIMTLLEQYRRALEARDLTVVASLYVEFQAAQRTALERYFSSVQNLQVRIDRVEIAIVGSEAVASYTRVDDFVDLPTDMPQHVSVRLTTMLRRVDGRWRFSGGLSSPPGK